MQKRYYRCMISSLFHPLNLGNRELKNRVIAAPPPSLLATENGLVTSELLDYYQSLSASGVCAVIVEGASVNASARAWQKQLDISASETLGGLSRLVEKIRQKGALPVIQLYHGGLNAFSDRSLQVKGPGNVRLKGLKYEIQPLSAAEIDQIVRDYVAAAIMSWNAGFSGIEIQAAEGSLLHQFLSPLTNTRTDQYGIQNHRGALLLVQIIKGIRHATSDLVLLCKLSLKDLAPGGSGISSIMQVAKILKKEGIELFHVTEGLIIGNPLRRHTSLDKTAPDASFAEDAQIFRNELQHPVILSGRVTTPQVAEFRISKSFCDMVSLGRTLNRHKNWLKDAQLQMPVPSKPCLRCEICLSASQGCPDKQKF